MLLFISGPDAIGIDSYKVSFLIHAGFFYILTFMLDNCHVIQESIVIIAYGIYVDHLEYIIKVINRIIYSSIKIAKLQIYKTQKLHTLQSECTQKIYNIIL